MTKPYDPDGGGKKYEKMIQVPFWKIKTIWGRRDQIILFGLRFSLIAATVISAFVAPFIEIGSFPLGLICYFILSITIFLGTSIGFVRFYIIEDDGAGRLVRESESSGTPNSRRNKYKN